MRVNIFIALADDVHKALFICLNGYCETMKLTRVEHSNTNRRYIMSNPWKISSNNLILVANNDN